MLLFARSVLAFLERAPLRFALLTRAKKLLRAELGEIGELTARFQLADAALCDPEKLGQVTLF